MEQSIYHFALFAGCVFFVVTAVWLLLLKPEKLPFWEKLPRSRHLGGVLALAALLWCVPHARPIVWDWMVPHLVTIVIACAVIAYFFLDYLFARASAGLMILLAYYYIHEAFEYHTPGAPLLSLMMWIFGVIGIVISARPYYERDMIRKLCRERVWRIAGAVYCLICAALMLYGGVR